MDSPRHSGGVVLFNGIEGRAWKSQNALMSEARRNTFAFWVGWQQSIGPGHGGWVTAYQGPQPSSRDFPQPTQVAFAGGTTWSAETGFTELPQRRMCSGDFHRSWSAQIKSFKDKKDMIKDTKDMIQFMISIIIQYIYVYLETFTFV